MSLTVVSLVVAALFVLPTSYLVGRNLGLGSQLWATVTSVDTLVALWRSVSLAAAVSASAAVLGTGLAWLTVRSDLPGRRVVRILAPLPLVLPSFVAAAALLAAVAPGGLLEWLLGPFGVERLPEVRGFFGAWLVLTLFTYPYVYLPVAARFATLPPSLEESARLLGRRPGAVFRTVVLPQSATAIWAGTLLVFLYAISDFGAVELMRYGALTREIFQGKLQPSTWLPLALVLALVALAVVAFERTANRRLARTEAVKARRPLQVPLGRWRWPAFAAVVVVIGNAVVGPLLVLGQWAGRGLANPAERSRALASDVGGLLRPSLTTVALGLAAAVVTVALVLPVAYLTGRYRSRAASVSNATVVGGFALPGLVVALALGSLVLGSPLSWLYQTLPVLIAAYAVHFGAQAMRASQVAVTAVPRRLDEAARMLGAGRWRRLRTVDVPLMWPGLVAGGGLVLLSTMKELPATLLLAPPGVTTLATRIWSATESGRLAQVGVASLLLVALSGTLTWLLVLRRSERFD
jgi:iron(III) transport system permease protein